ncbi:MAG: ABC transporter permease [Dermatophilaceae bacterium]
MPGTTSGERSQTRLTGALVAQLVRKDLRVKYQGSSLGFLWSLVNPLLQLVVYTFVFQFVMKSPIPVFGFFLLSGLLIWNFFSMSVSGAAGSVIGNAALVKKVPFPHSALPLAAIGFAGIQVLLQFVVLLVGLVVAGMAPLRPEVLLLVPALIVLLMLAVGLGLFAAATTVRLRDMQHLLEVGLFAWMWITPIIYPPAFVHQVLGDQLTYAYYLNPMAGVVAAFQRALYGVVRVPQNGDLILASDSNWFYLQVLGIGFVVSALVLAVGMWQFNRLSQDFAEDL